MEEKQVFKGHVMSESHKSVKMCHLAPWEYDLYMLSSSNYCYTAAIAEILAWFCSINPLKHNSIQILYHL